MVLFRVINNAKMGKASSQRRFWTPVNTQNKSYEQVMNRL
jgi:hypothetical protein